MAAGYQHYTQVVLFKAYTELITETTKTYVGIGWWILDPILYMSIFYFVFDVMMQRGGPDFVPFLLVGLVFFRWFGNSLSNGCMSIRQGHALMQQVYLPKAVFPLVNYLTNTFKFFCTFALLLPFLWWSGYPPGMHYLALIPLLLIQSIFNIGCLFIAAAVIPLLPDLKYLVNHGVTILLFTSGIFYRISELPDDLQGYLEINPLASLLSAFRTVLMDGRWPSDHQLLTALGIGLTLLLVGVVMINRLDRKYPKIVRMRGA